MALLCSVYDNGLSVGVHFMLPPRSLFLSLSLSSSYTSSKSGTYYL